MEKKQLVIAVDGTSEMAPHWETILRDYLEKIIRYFCHNESTSQDPSCGKSLLGLVVYGANEAYSGCLVQPNSWTRDMDIFLQWLSALSFSGGGFDEAAIAEGLSNALMMFPENLNGSQTQQFGQRHCILVAASNPFPLPRPVLLPKIQISNSGKISEGRMEYHLADAETVARSFAQSFVSLSVICPKQFPRLRAIFNEGNYHQAAESSVSDVNNPQYLVLLPENFVEAHAALNQCEVESKLMFETETDLIPPFPRRFSDDDMMILQQIFNEPLMSQQEIPAVNINPSATVQPNEENKIWDSGKSFMRQPSKIKDDDNMTFQEILDELMMNQQGISNPTASVQPKRAKENSDDGDNIRMLRKKLSEPAMSEQGISGEVESDAVRSKVPWSAFEQCSYVPDSSYRTNVQTSSHSFTSQENIGFDDFKVELTPTGIVLSQGIRPRNLAKVNASLLRNFNLQQVMKSTAIRPERSPAGSQISSAGNKSAHQTMLSLQVNSKAVVRTPQSAQHSNNGSISLVDSNISGNLKISQSSGLQTTGCFTLSLHRTMQPTNKPDSLVKNPHGGRQTITGSSTSAPSNVYENLWISKHLANLQGHISTHQSPPIMTQGHFSMAQKVQDEYGLKRKHVNAFGRPHISNEAGIAIPMVGKSKRVQGEMESVAVANSSGTKSALSQQRQTSRFQPGPPNGYIKAWEGDLTSKESGQTVLVNRLVAYRKTSTSEKFAINWPQTLHMDQLISQNYLNNKPYEGDVEYLIFDAVNHCKKLDELEEKRLCAYIKLPQQTLILSVSTNKLRLIGTLYSGAFPLFKHQIYSP